MKSVHDFHIVVGQFLLSWTLSNSAPITRVVVSVFIEFTDCRRPFCAKSKYTKFASSAFFRILQHLATIHKF